MSQYQDNGYKFIAVLNKKIDNAKLMNALGHIAVGLSSMGDIDAMSFIEYKDKDGGIHPAISRFPFIILSADNGSQIRTLREQAINSSIQYNDFTSSMLGSSAEVQLEQTANISNADLEYFAIVLFGSSSNLNSLTKKFSLFK